LCGVSIGAEDYIKIAELCKFILIDGVPNFNDENADKQQRFIILIDILYEKKIPIMITANFNYKNFKSSRKLVNPYKRTISRLFELTSPKFKINWIKSSSLEKLYLVNRYVFFLDIVWLFHSYIDPFKKLN